MLDWTGAAIFSLALLMAAASPGPGIAAIVARVLGRGLDGAVAFTAGVAIGDVVWLTLAVGGLALLAQTFQAVFVVVKWCGVAYLVYLAYKMWVTPAVAQDVTATARKEKRAALFAAGLAVTLGNPKVMVFYLALLPTLIRLEQISFAGYLELVALTLGILAVVFGAYIVAAQQARALFRSARAMRAVNRGSAVAMTGAAAWVASR